MSVSPEQNMKLVVLGNESLDALQAMVLSSFADVSQGSRPDTHLQVGKTSMYILYHECICMVCV